MARGEPSIASSASMHVVGMPAWESRRVVKRPTGPAPTTMIDRSFMMVESYNAVSTKEMVNAIQSTTIG